MLYVLRNELDQHGPRFGCGLAQCGACTVHLDGRATSWSVAAVQVGHVRHELVAVLDQFGRAWSPQCPGQALDYGRVDSLVDYLERPHWLTFEPHTVALTQRMAPLLRDAVLPLTRGLARGLGFAEDARTKHSFGQGLCAALADGARRVACDPGIDLPQALRCLAQSLQSHTIDPLRPWLSPSHEAELSVPVTCAAMRRSSTMTGWCQRYARQGDLGALAEAGAALHSLRAPVAAARRALEAGGTFDASLCHGLGGGVELFTLAHQATGLPDHGRAAQHAGRLCLALRRANAGRWTSRLQGATAVPGLMVGDAVIGTMLLRWHQPAIGSPLRPGLD